MENAKPVKIPLIKNEERKTPIKEVFGYRETIGSLLYLSTKTRPDMYILWSRILQSFH